LQEQQTTDTSRHQQHDITAAQHCTKQHSIALNHASVSSG
jgi:hypothetical protein